MSDAPTSGGDRPDADLPEAEALARAGWSEEELLALCRVVGERDGTSLEFITDGCLHGFSDFRQLTRGIVLDPIEQVTIGAPYADVKYGEGQLKFLAKRT